MSFLNENIAQNSRTGVNGFQLGVNNHDDATINEISFLLPWKNDPASSYLNYWCYLRCELDAGLAIHRVLPQSVYDPDSLGVIDVSKGLASANSKNGVNTISNASFFGDIIQRMANSRYRFCLKGSARRAGYQVSIPKLLTVAGITAYPDDKTPQKAFNVIADNMGGVPIYYAEWELWYTVIAPPSGAVDPPADFADVIDATPPDQAVPSLVPGLQIPISSPDSNQA